MLRLVARATRAPSAVRAASAWPRRHAHGERPRGSASEIEAKHVTARLHSLVRADRLNEAFAILHNRMRRGTANTYHLGVVLKACKSSAYMRMLIGRGEQVAGIEPDTSTYNILLNQLRIEGKADEVDGLVREMEGRGVQPCERTRAVLEMPVEQLEVRRSGELARLVRAGDAKAARELLECMMACGVANEVHVGVLLKAQRTVEEVRALIERAEAEGIALGVAPFNLLLSRLILEGRDGEKGDVLEMMAERGIEADERTRQTLEYSAAALSRMRTAEMMQLLQSGDNDAVRASYDRLLAAGVADSFQLGVAMLTCGSAEEQLRMIEAAEARRVAPGTSQFNCVLARLQRDGRASPSAREWVLGEMSRRGLEPDGDTRKMLEAVGAGWTEGLRSSWERRWTEGQRRGRGRRQRGRET